MLRWQRYLKSFLGEDKDLFILHSQYNNYINPGYGLSLVDTLWNASSYRQPLEQEGNPMTWIEQFWLQISLIVAKKS